MQKEKKIKMSKAISSPVELRQLLNGTVRYNAVLLILDASIVLLAHRFHQKRAQMHRLSIVHLASLQIKFPRIHQAPCMIFHH